MIGNDLIGYQAGSLTVLEDSGERKRGSILWRCQCICGGDILLTRGQLMSGAVRDCGCTTRERSRFGRAADLTGQTFGALTVLRRAENGPDARGRWVCQCVCGTITTVTAARLKSGHTRSCGCQRYTRFRGRNLTGQQFGRLVAMYPVRKENQATTWHCRCACGNETDVCAANLLRGSTRSCGCLNQERRARMNEYLHYTGDTCVERLVRAQNNGPENRSGFRGICRMPGGLYRAAITFQKTHYTLGYYETFDDAVQARLDAESSLHNGFIRAWTQWKAKAEADPDWADGNPFYYRVERVSGTFRIETNA